MSFINPGEIFIKTHGAVASVDDVRRYAQFLRDEADIDGEPPIDLARIYTRFGIKTPARVQLPGQQGLLINPDKGKILIHADDPATRQRFTEAHELMELLFAVLPVTSWGGERRIAGFSETAKEKICDQGAAELIMPQASFLPRIRSMGVSFLTARQLCAEYEVSLTAAIVNMALIGPGKHAVVLWKWKHKPTELREQPDQTQLSFFIDQPRTIPKRLRVEWAMVKEGSQYIPTDKSVPDNSCICTAAREGIFTTGREYLSLGKVEGYYYCEN